MYKKKITILMHLSGWIAFFLVPILLFNLSHINEPAKFSLFHEQHTRYHQPELFFILSKNLFLIIFFYLNLYLLLPELYYRKKILLYFVVIASFIMISFSLPSFIKNETFYNSRTLIIENRSLNKPNLDKIFGPLYFVIIWFLSSIICLADRYRKMEQRNKEMKVQQLNAELTYLKAQIKPHFLFNTLNNIYALAICQNEQTPEAILKLSAIMRYVTEDATADTVALTKEMDYLKNYIALQQLRSNNKLKVDFEITGNPKENKIAPLLLINFIENAFKYGISSHVPCYIKIDIIILNNNITLKVTNKIIAGIVPQSTFTGANNTLRRLQLQYANKHILKIDESNDLYKVILQIQLA